MIVWVDDALFTPGAARDVDRLALLRGAAWRAHTLTVSSSRDGCLTAPNSPSCDGWRRGLAPELQREVAHLLEFLGQVSPTAVTRGAELLPVSNRPEDLHANGCISLEQAIRAVALPLHVLVENVLSDASFLRRVLPPVWRDRLRQWERAGHVVYENGGGTTVMTSIVEHFGDDGRARDTWGLPSAIWRLVHFVIHDHDGNAARRPGKHSAALSRACEQVRMEGRSHCLERRDQEHYLPADALVQIAQVRLTDAQQLAALLAALATFSALPDHGRWFGALPGLGQSRFFHNEFHRYRDADWWRDRWFERDGTWREMTRLAESIASAL